MRRLLRLLGWLTSIVIVLVLITVGWSWVQLGRSLPQLDGMRVLSGLTTDVTVDRDSLGVPTIKGASRVDVGRALGFVHAQDRFFQMDLSRRRAAGELSELFGQAALATDRGARLHRFRHRAAAVLAASSPDELALLDAYVAGVNAGLDAMAAPPFEYLFLGQTPARWTGFASSHRRHAARHHFDDRGQQRPHRVGFHEHHGRLERSRAHRARTG